MIDDILQFALLQPIIFDIPTWTLLSYTIVYNKVHFRNWVIVWTLNATLNVSQVRLRETQEKFKKFAFKFLIVDTFRASSNMEYAIK